MVQNSNDISYKEEKRTKKWIFYYPTKTQTYTQIKKHQIEEAV